MTIAIAGCGALGSNIALMIATNETNLTLFDFDTVDENNVFTGTSAFMGSHIGLRKVDALAGLLYEKYGIVSRTFHRQVRSERDLDGFDLVLDCFDNMEARVCSHGYNTLHIGLSPQFVGSIVWDHAWVFFKQPNLLDTQENPICTHQVGRNIINMTSAVASVIINRWIETGEKINRTVKGVEVF